VGQGFVEKLAIKWPIGSGYTTKLKRIQYVAQCVHLCTTAESHDLALGFKSYGTIIGTL